MPPRFPENCPEGFIGHYFVVSGDTMSLIASYFGTTTRNLEGANPHITNPNFIRPGDVLCVPGFRKPTTCPVGFTNRLEVKEGDTFFSIARELDVSVVELITANRHIPNPNFLFPFDILCVP